MTSTGTHSNDIAAPAAAVTEPSQSWDDFESFYRAEHAVMERALVMAIGDLEMGRDATAEGFARALQRWRKVRRYSNPSGWVYRVSLNWAHSRRRRIHRDAAHPAAATPVSTNDVPGALSGEVTNALLQLGPDHRAIVVGRFVLDWSEAQVAAALDIPPGTAKSRSSRALAHLAELLEDRHD